MKIFKNKKLLFLGASSTLAVAPMTTVSCLYRDNPTVQYANTFVKNNAYTEKNKITYTQDDLKIPALQAFEDSLYNNKLLIYSFNFYIYGLSQKVSVSNEHLRINITKEVGKLFNFNKEQTEIIINKTNIEKIKQKFNEQIYNETKEFVEKSVASVNEKYQKYVKFINKHNKKSNNKIKIRNLVEIALIEYQSLVESTPEYLKQEINLHKEIESISQFTVLDKTKSNLLITDEKVERVVKNYLKDTPFYQKYIKYQNNPEMDKRILSFKDGTWTFELTKNDVSYGAIPYGYFTNLYLNINKKYGSINQVKQEPKNVLKAFVEQFEKTAFNVDLNEVDGNKGIFLGFGPLNILEGKNISTNDKDDDFRIFDTSNRKEFNEKEIKMFLNEPIEFFNTHLNVLFIPEIYSINRTIKADTTKLEKATEKRNVFDINKYKNRIKNDEDKLKIINKHKEEIQELVNKRVNIEKSTNKNKQELLEKNKQEMINLTKKYFKNAYDEALEKLKTGISVSKANIQQLAKLYAVSIFGLGAYKTQIIKGSVDGKQTYWIEILGKEGDKEKWFMFDTLKSYLSQRPHIEQNLYSKESLKGYDFNKELFIKLPSNYKIDESFEEVAHVK